MDALHAIMSRRSIRKYEQRPVDPQTVEQLLRAAMAAPSAGNQQTWRFIVVTDRARLDRLATTSPYAGMLEHSPLAIVVLGDTENEKHPDYWVEDCSAAMQNLLLAAHAIGLGAVWLGYHPNDDRKDRLREEFGLPDNIQPLGIASIGHPAEEKTPADRYNPDFVHTGTW
jgi:nitroreductase